MNKILAVSLLLASASAQAVNYNVQLLPSLSAGGNSWAYGMNDNGMVVGQSYNSTTGLKEAVVWSGGSVTSLGVEGLARAVNNSGLVVGEVGTANLAFPTGQAFQWQGSGPVVGIGSLNGLYSGAYDVNESGVITGYSCTDMAPTCILQSHGFRYENGTMTDIGTVSVADGYSRGHGINDAGTIAGRASLLTFNNSNKYMTVWDANDNLTSVVSPGIGNYSAAQQINNNGIVVGNGYAFGTTMRGMVWDADNNLTAVMGSFGGTRSRAWSINDLGTIVGYAEDIANDQRAMVSYDGGHTLLDLNDLAVDLTGWLSLDEAYDINESGQIVGIGTLTDGSRGAFVLTAVPVPAAVWLFISACAALFGFRRSAR